ncbi:ankyrin repeat-containing [Fusarium longipes]|uniref:Ankyrin repeat-containing n=1 Tax=Fusarium longipes TaxID=694270 RepID=A0A395T7S8_9HYPO|nr:ankyrin repeat-containing [Fusarium longipes]
MAPVTGSCWCKAVKYEFDYEPTQKARVLKAMKIHSAPFAVNMMVPATEVKIVSGQDHLQRYKGVHVLGMPVTTVFCKNCGSTMHKIVELEGFSHNFAIPSATLDNVGETLGSDVIGPAQEAFLSHKPKWMPEFPQLEYASAVQSIVQ